MASSITSCVIVDWVLGTCVHTCSMVPGLCFSFPPPHPILTGLALALQPLHWQPSPWTHQSYPMNLIATLILPTPKPHPAIAYVGLPAPMDFYTAGVWSTILPPKVSHITVDRISGWHKSILFFVKTSGDLLNIYSSLKQRAQTGVLNLSKWKSACPFLLWQTLISLFLITLQLTMLFLLMILQHNQCGSNSKDKLKVLFSVCISQNGFYITTLLAHNPA